MKNEKLTFRRKHEKRKANVPEETRKTKSRQSLEIRKIFGMA